MDVVPIANIAPRDTSMVAAESFGRSDPYVDTVRNGPASRYVPTLPRTSASRAAVSNTIGPANSSAVVADSVPAAARTYPKLGCGNVLVAMMGAGA
jgi:hypothetical protein